MAAATPKTLFQKISAASVEMENPSKRALNPHFKAKYASLGDTMDVIEPVLAKHKLAHMYFFDGTFLVYQVFDPDTNEVIQSKVDIVTLMQGLSGNVWQGMGQAVTYMRRYLAQAFWNLVPEDDDGNSAPSKAPQRASNASEEPTVGNATGSGSGDAGGVL